MYVYMCYYYYYYGVYNFISAAVAVVTASDSANEGIACLVRIYAGFIGIARYII